MKTKSAYALKLQDPRWQKKRLEILQRDKFACVQCGDQTTTLHVHHIRYEKGKEPWDYPPSSLITLCSVCHEAEHDYGREAIKEAWDEAFVFLQMLGFTNHNTVDFVDSIRLSAEAVCRFGFQPSPAIPGELMNMCGEQIHQRVTAVKGCRDENTNY